MNVHPPQYDDCPRCGYPLAGQRCKVICDRCGYQEDCSDAGLPGTYRSSHTERKPADPRGQSDNKRESDKVGN
ncbi:MAG: hypothetical protein IT324_11970 [Anaerolineae bacterium]|nr:hypothetical protein [Anaerolineae bacterium]